MKLTKRGERVGALALTLLIGGSLYFILWLSSNFWWTGSGICLGSAVKCLAGGL